MFAVRIENLTKVYKQAGKSIPALSGLSMDILEGEVFGFLGPNGAGKTTTIKLLVNLIYPTTGMAWIFDKECIHAEARRQVGFLPETPMFYDYLTLEELLWFSGRASGMRFVDIATRTKELLVLLDMERAKKLQLRKFSKGMIQRAGLAQALIADPQILILDEPMSGLDPLGRNDFVGLIRKLKTEGKTIFFSSHVLSDIEALCDRVGILVKGELRKLERVEDLLHRTSAGFTMQIAGLDGEGENLLNNLGPAIRREGNIVTLNIPQDKFMDAIDIVKARKASVFSVDTRRKTLEEVFLNVLNGNS
jgi:ABC-2 type transport system ATP-binding protein